MRTTRRHTQILSVLLMAGWWLLLPQNSHAQNAPATSASADASPDVRALADVVRQLQDQVKTSPCSKPLRRRSRLPTKRRMGKCASCATSCTVRLSRMCSK